MSHDKSGTQTRGCSVVSSKHNTQGSYCQLSRIQVEPMCNCEGCHSGNPADESLCGSYRAK